MLLLLSGCSLFQPRIITLCTNRPEMAAYVEYFNTLSADYRVVLCYKPNPAESVIGRNRDADYVRWYQEMLEVTEPDGLPYAYADWPVSEDRLHIFHGSMDIEIRLPPAHTQERT